MVLYFADGEMIEEDKEELNQMMVALFAEVFYVDNAYMAARDPIFLQSVLDILVNTLDVLVLRTSQRPMK